MASIFLKNAKELAYPLAMLCNTTIGVGIFALPYIASKAGLAAMAAYFILLGAVICAIHLIFARIALKTPDHKRLPGFAKQHLGAKAEIAVLACVIASGISVMVVFMSIGGQFLYDITGKYLGGPEFAYGILYGLAGLLLVLLGINIVEKIVFWGLLIFFGVLAVLISNMAPSFKWENLAVSSGKLSDIFMPYGPVIFSIWGASSIPEVEEMLGRKRKKRFLMPLVLLSLIISIIVYFIFTIAVVGLTGSQTTPSALIGLKNYFDGGLLKLTFFFGLVTTFTSFVIAGLTLKKILCYDLGLSRNTAWLIAAFAPLMLYAAASSSYLAILSFIGGVMLGIEGIIILMMYNKIWPQKKFIAYSLALFFLFGVLLEIASLAAF